MSFAGSTQRVSTRRHSPSARRELIVRRRCRRATGSLPLFCRYFLPRHVRAIAAGLSGPERRSRVPAARQKVRLVQRFWPKQRDAPGRNRTSACGLGSRGRFQKSCCKSAVHVALSVSGGPSPEISTVRPSFYTRLMAACPTCGTESPETAKFCAECGERLRPAVAPERFRRNVTILFSDVVGSTALGERLDPETLARVMGDYFAAVKPAVERHGGTLAKFIGDAVMAVFGLVELHEDDALRAVRAALEMRQTLAVLNPELEQRYGVALTTRTGINTGLVAGQGLMPDRNFVAGDTANT